MDDGYGEYDDSGDPVRTVTGLGPDLDWIWGWE